MLKAGDKAPDFSATTTDGNVISLHDYFGRNNVVLYFYPEDDTAGCTAEACEFRDSKVDYDRTNTVVLGVSNDDQASHQAFTTKYDLNFPLLVDTSGEICDAYEVPHESGPKRITYLINTDGIIEKAWEKFNARGHAADVLGAIAELGRS